MKGPYVRPSPSGGAEIILDNLSMAVDKDQLLTVADFLAHGFDTGRTVTITSTDGLMRMNIEHVMLYSIAGQLRAIAGVPNEEDIGLSLGHPEKGSA